jgi:hypothetical protein
MVLNYFEILAPNPQRLLFCIWKFAAETIEPSLLYFTIEKSVQKILWQDLLLDAHCTWQAGWLQLSFS